MDGLNINLERDLHLADVGLERFVMRLVAQIAGVGRIEVGPPGRQLLSLIVRHARTGHPELLELVIARITDEHIATERIVDVYIPAAAKKIGTAWHEGELDILSTSVAIARLQTMLRVLGRALMADDAIFACDQRILLVVPEKEQHTLGGVIVAHQLRRLGVSVRLEFMPTPHQLARLVRESDYDAVFFSISNRSLLETARNLVKTVKCATTSAVPVVIGGSLVGAVDSLADRTGADCATLSVIDALTSTGLLMQDRAAQ